MNLGAGAGNLLHKAITIATLGIVQPASSRYLELLLSAWKFMALIVPIKIHCGCGQRYAFEVEPVGGRMPGAVTCPKCGVDGTSAANVVLEQQFPAQPAVAIPTPQRVTVPQAGASSMRVGAPPLPATAMQANGNGSAVRFSSQQPAAAAPPVSAPVEKKRLPGQLEPERAAAEARSKVMWGDDPGEISKFLMGHGFSIDEAKETLAPFLIERTQAVRTAGTRKIFIGIGMICVPIVTLISFFMSGFFEIKILGGTIAIGLWGLTKVLSGTLMVLSPKSEKGDIADM